MNRRSLSVSSGDGFVSAAIALDDGPHTVRLSKKPLVLTIISAVKIQLRRFMETSLRSGRHEYDSLPSGTMASLKRNSEAKLRFRDEVNRSQLMARSYVGKALRQRERGKCKSRFKQCRVVVKACTNYKGVITNISRDLSHADLPRLAGQAILAEG